MSAMDENIDALGCNTVAVELHQRSDRSLVIGLAVRSCPSGCTHRGSELTKLHCYSVTPSAMCS